MNLETPWPRSGPRSFSAGSAIFKRCAGGWCFILGTSWPRGVRPPGINLPVECDRRASSKGRPMPEAVIVDVVRTPIGRAFKGSLASLRPDEALAHVVDRVLERNPEIDPSSVEELIAGCGQPQGLQANNIARIAVLLSDKLGEETTGSTVSRYCASGLDAIRAAAKNVVAGAG